MMNAAAVLCIFALIAALLSAGCATSPSVRYTQEEIKDFPTDVQQRVIKGEVMLGMTPKQVRYAWGQPESVRTLTPYEGRAREEWTYTKFGVYETKKLLFLDGRLIYMVPEPDRVSEMTDRPAQERGGTAPGAGDSEKVHETIKLQEPGR